MDETTKTKRFGLIGKNISYSFSKGYFTEKFKHLGLANHTYENFDLEDIYLFKEVMQQKNICGLNVTIPYKEVIIPYLDSLDEDAKAIGAVNVIKFKDGKITGHNTDAYGFKQSVLPLLHPTHKKALILGTGGASKAIVFVLQQLGISCQYVSRTPKEGYLTYSTLTPNHIQDHTIIVNCSPVGTHPNITDKPLLPYDDINEGHILFDLIYNPAATAFLKEGQRRGAQTQNGLPMLEFQAEKAWEIWNDSL